MSTSYFNPRTPSTDYASLLAAVAAENAAHAAEMGAARDRIAVDNTRFRARTVPPAWLDTANLALFALYYCLLAALAYRLYALASVGRAAKAGALLALALFPPFALSAEVFLGNCARFVHAWMLGLVYVPYRDL